MQLPGEVAHRYGPHVHVLDDSLLLTPLARVGSPSIGPRDLPRLIRRLYEHLAAVVMAREFRVLDHYQREVPGRPRRILSMPMIATPGFLLRVKAGHPEVTIYTARLDRGLRPPEVLAEVPGTHPELERGLDDTQYIVPGAGGTGEVLTNSFC